MERGFLKSMSGAQMNNEGHVGSSSVLLGDLGKEVTNFNGSASKGMKSDGKLSGMNSTLTSVTALNGNIPTLV